jgi:hypothetical protein
VYCEVTPPTAIIGGTAIYSYDLYITDASPTLTLALGFGGQFTSTDNTECPLSVYNGDTGAEGYATPSPFAAQPTYDSLT